MTRYLVLAVALAACGSSKSAAPTKEPTPPGDPCVASGGSCVGVGECGPSVGHLGDASCGNPSLACCITPVDSCGGAETFACCTESAEFRPTCRAGALVCPEGQTKSSGAHCPGVQ